MVRPLLPKEQQTRPRPIIDTPNGSKRRCVSSACIPCRKRKSKCDGGTPACATCTAVYFSECEYDVESDHRRKGALKRDIENLKERNDALGIIVAAIQSASDEEVDDIVRHIRSKEKLEVLAETLRHNVPLPERSGSPSLEGDLSEIMGKPILDESGETRYFGHTSSLSLAREHNILPRVESPSASWTEVTDDVEFVEHLIELYFSWSHTFHVVLEEESFRCDMLAGRTKYCSSLLVNAICSLACAFSDRPEARVDPGDANTAGDHFFEEARRLLHEQEISSLTSVEALTIMSIREPNHNRDSTGYSYSGRAMRMALELGLHLSYTGVGPVTLSQSEINARRITFWGCFTVETLWGICVGRLPMVPTTAISLEKPPLGLLDAKPWKPYIDRDIPFGPESERAGTVQFVAGHFTTLAMIMNETLSAFYAPRYRMTSKSLLDLYAKGTAWYAALPKELLAKNTPSPSVILLNMTYHCFIIHLFRPFLRVSLLHSTVSPRDLCTHAAAEISALMTLYRNMYGLRRIMVIAGHMLLSSGTIHLINMPSPVAEQHLVQCTRDLEAISLYSMFPLRALDILRSLAQKWEIAVPEELQDTAQRIADASVRPTCSGDYETAQYPSSSHAASQATVVIPGEPGFPVDDIFWLPTLNYVEPLTGEPRPMQFTGLSSSSAYDWEQLSHDGFKKANMSDPPMGPPTTNGYWPHI